MKNLPAMQETRVQSLGWEDALEKGMATHSSILAWKIPWTEEPAGLQSMGLQRVGLNNNPSNVQSRAALQANAVVAQQRLLIGTGHLY